MLSLTNQIAHALKAKNQRNTKLSKRKSKMLCNSSGSDESSDDDSDFSEISESDDESGSDTDWKEQEIREEKEEASGGK